MMSTHNEGSLALVVSTNCFLLCLLQLSPSFTPTSVIRKMYESKEKSKEEPVSGKLKVSDGKDENQRPNEGIVMALN